MALLLETILAGRVSLNEVPHRLVSAKTRELHGIHVAVDFVNGDRELAIFFFFAEFSVVVIWFE